MFQVEKYFGMSPYSTDDMPIAKFWDVQEYMYAQNYVDGVYDEIETT